MDITVGYGASSILEELCKEAITTAWQAREYVVMNEYIVKYERLRKYNEVKK
jgi:hypothetical protein